MKAHWRTKNRFGTVLGLAIGLAFSSSARAEVRVEFELVTGPDTPAVAAQQWLAALRNVKLDSLRVRSGRSGDRVEVRQRGSGQDVTYQVTGLLTARNTLQLPGGEFRQGDTAGITAWLAKLKEGGQQRLQETEAAFGLTPTQLLAVHEKLAVPVTAKTKGQNSYEAMRQIAGGMTLSFVADADARQRMAGGDPVLDELQGLSAGTALAAILRPLGLVLVPQKQAGGEVKLGIVDVRRAAESWPVGWPPEKSPRETLPELFSFLNVEIEDTALSSALETIAERIKAPILYDHNSLARQRIDPDQARVSYPAERTYYQRIIDRMVNQARLTSELRVDEAGRPLLWISTLRRGP